MKTPLKLKKVVGYKADNRKGGGGNTVMEESLEK